MTIRQDAMLPIIRQMHEAGSHEERARVLLCVPDALLMKYRDVFERACTQAGFEMGLRFIMVRRAAWGAVRGPDGRHKNALFEEARATLAAFAGTEGGAP